MTSPAVPRSSRFETWRLFVVYGVIFIVLVVLLGKLLSLQVLGSQNWIDAAVANYTKEISLPAARGIIYDRNGYVLARNVASYNVTIIPANLPDDTADIQRIYRDISTLTGIPVNSGTVEQAKLYAPCVEGPGISQLVDLGDSIAPYSPVEIKCNVDENVARLIQEHESDWPGVGIEVNPIRDYPTGSLTADVIGYLGPIPAILEPELTARGFVANRDKYGYAGIELSLQDVLAGQNGKRVVQVDVAGQEIRNLQPPIAAQPGYNVSLTIDTRLQQAAEASLLREINYWNTYFYGNTGQIRISSGVVMAMNPKTGEILAMVSYPTYQNNRMARFIPYTYYQQLSQDPRHPLLNNTIQSEYPPGSTFKLAAANGVLNEGVISSPNQIINAPGQIELCNVYTPNEPCGPNNMHPFVDWIYDTDPAGFGQIDFYHCIAYSSDVCFYKLGGGFGTEIPNGGLGIFRLGEYARALGYGAPSGIELPGEASGLIPDPKWKRITQGENWSTGDTYIATVGQGYVLATPLQVLMSGETMANSGKLMQPTIVRQITDSAGNVQTVWYSPSDLTQWVPHQSVDAQGNVHQDWQKLGDGTIANQLPAGSYQISPFVPNMKWDITKDPRIGTFTCEAGNCIPTGQYKTVAPSVVKDVQAGMRLAVTDPRGTLHAAFVTDYPLPIAVAGKTGTAEYCDDVALAANRCQYGQWPSHGWTLAYAPYENPEIVVAAFMYNGGEGAVVAAPVVARVMQAYFALKSIDQANATGGG
ncbi:MAG: penicillin-binding transpeptidase domain-containing protein [Chloroflexi bacterium]|nr:penicillin-binding transpeptidase domain-containing protein [Chloroflexota bacterium]